MGRKPVDENEKKVKITIRLKKVTVEKLRKIKNYNAEVQKLLENFLK